MERGAAGCPLWSNSVIGGDVLCTTALAPKADTHPRCCMSRKCEKPREQMQRTIRSPHQCGRAALWHFEAEYFASLEGGLADEHGQADGGNAGNGFHSMSSGRIDLKTASPDW